MNDIDNGEAIHVGAEGQWEICVLSLQCCAKPKKCSKKKDL